jgi:hypothetical protein
MSRNPALLHKCVEIVWVNENLPFSALGAKTVMGQALLLAPLIKETTGI